MGNILNDSPRYLRRGFTTFKRCRHSLTRSLAHSLTPRTQALIISGALTLLFLVCWLFSWASSPPQHNEFAHWQEPRSQHLPARTGSGLRHRRSHTEPRVVVPTVHGIRSPNRDYTCHSFADGPPPPRLSSNPELERRRPGGWQQCAYSRLVL